MGSLLKNSISVAQNDPELAQAILGDNINRLQELLQERHRQRSELRRKQEEELVSLFGFIFGLLFVHCCLILNFLAFLIVFFDILPCGSSYQSTYFLSSSFSLEVLLFQPLNILFPKLLRDLDLLTL